MRIPLNTGSTAAQVFSKVVLTLAGSELGRGTLLESQSVSVCINKYTDTYVA